MTHSMPRQDMERLLWRGEDGGQPHPDQGAQQPPGGSSPQYSIVDHHFSFAFLQSIDHHPTNLREVAEST